MFNVVLRSGILLVGGSLVLIPILWVLGALAEIAAQVGPDGSQNAHWLTVTDTWLPMLVLGAGALALLAGAAARRGGGGGY